MRNLQDTLRERLGNDMARIEKNLADQMEVAASFQEELSRTRGRLTDNERQALTNYMRGLTSIKGDFYIDTLMERVDSNLESYTQ